MFLIITGSIATSINIAEIKNIMCIDVRNLPIINCVVALVAADDDVVVIAKVAAVSPKIMVFICWIGIMPAIIRKAIPKLNVLPINIRVVLVPAATPLLNDFTEFIIEALLGEANTPIPAPISKSGDRRSIKEAVASNFISIRKPIADKIKPIDDMTLDPYLSDNQPLIGPHIASAPDTGIR